MPRKYFCIIRSIFTIKSVKRKTIIFYKNYICFAIYLILYFVIIVFAYNAFYFKLVFARLSLYILHNFFSLDSRIIIDFAFRNNILNIFIFCRSTQLIKNVHVDFLRTLFANSISY